jgi:hypothetical protein
MNRDYQLIDYAVGSNVPRHFQTVVLASCCRISPIDSRRQPLKTFEPTGSEGRSSRSVTHLVKVGRQSLTLPFNTIDLNSTISTITFPTRNEFLQCLLLAHRLGL